MKGWQTRQIELDLAVGERNVFRHWGMVPQDQSPGTQGSETMSAADGSFRTAPPREDVNAFRTRRTAGTARDLVSGPADKNTKMLNLPNI